MVVLTSTLLAANSYEVQIPLLRNPAAPYYSKFSAKVSLVQYNQFSQEVFNSYEFNNYIDIKSNLIKDITPGSMISSSKVAAANNLKFELPLSTATEESVGSAPWIMFQ